MEGHIVGVFGAERDLKARFEASIATKSELGRLVVYRREEGKMISFLDDPQFPETIQVYAWIASISDHAYYLFPRSGRLSAPDGELAVLLESFMVPGRVETVDSKVTPGDVLIALKKMSLVSYPVESRSSDSPVIDLAWLDRSAPAMPAGAMVCIDTVIGAKSDAEVLGFVLSGTISVHDKLRPIPSTSQKRAEVKRIQIDHQDQESAGKGMRVKLSLGGIDAKGLKNASWLDDGSFQLTQELGFAFARSVYYRREVDGTDLQLQLPGAMVPVRITKAGELYSAVLPGPTPVWDGMRLAVMDLNGTSLRVAGGGVAKVAP